VECTTILASQLGFFVSAADFSKFFAYFCLIYPAFCDSLVIDLYQFEPVRSAFSALVRADGRRKRNGI
jgi:hypothetical protein